MNKLKAFFAAMFLAVCSFAVVVFIGSPASQAKTKQIDTFTQTAPTNVTTPVANVDRATVFDQIIKADYTDSFPVAKSNAFARTKTITNLSSQNRNLIFNKGKIESPPDEYCAIGKAPENRFRPPNLFTRGGTNIIFRQRE